MISETSDGGSISFLRFFCNSSCHTRIQIFNRIDTANHSDLSFEIKNLFQTLNEYLLRIYLFIPCTFWNQVVNERAESEELCQDF